MTIADPVAAEAAVPTPFSLELTVRSHGWYQCPPFRWTAGSGELVRAERTADGDVLIRTWQAAPDRLRFEVVGADDPAVADAAVGAMTRMLRLDEDLRGFQRMAAGEPAIAGAAARGWGRILRGSSLWEDVIKALLGTNVQWRQAVRMIDQLCRLAPSSAHEPDLPLVPSPSEVLAAGEHGLREKVRCGYRARYLIQLAEGVLDGTHDLDGLDAGAARMDTGAVWRRLLALPGIGPATAAYLLTFLGHYDRPTVDSATVAYAAERYFDGEKRSLAEVRALFDHYAPYRALGAWCEVWAHWAGEKERRDALDR